MALYGSGIEPYSPKWESNLYGLIPVDGKIFSCQLCSWAIQVEYKFSVLVDKWSTYKQNDHYLPERGCCHACYKREKVFFEKNKRNAESLKAELQNLRSTSGERIKLRVLAVLKQIVAELTLVDIQQAIELPIDVSFGDCHASPKKRRELAKAFVQKHSRVIEFVIRERLLVEGSVTQMLIEYKSMVLPLTSQFQSLMEWGLVLKRTNAREGGLTYGGLTKPVGTAPTELFYGHHGVQVQSFIDCFNLSLDDIKYGLSTELAMHGTRDGFFLSLGHFEDGLSIELNKAFHEVMERVTEGSQRNAFGANQC